MLSGEGFILRCLLTILNHRSPFNIDNLVAVVRQKLEESGIQYFVGSQQGPIGAPYQWTPLVYRRLVVRGEAVDTPNVVVVQGEDQAGADGVTGLEAHQYMAARFFFFDLKDAGDLEQPPPRLLECFRAHLSNLIKHKKTSEHDYLDRALSYFDWAGNATHRVSDDGRGLRPTLTERS